MCWNLGSRAILSCYFIDKPIQTNKNKSSNEKFSLIDNIGTDAKDDNFLNKEMLKKALENLNEREKNGLFEVL